MSIKRAAAATIAAAAAITLTAALAPSAEAATKAKLLVSRDYQMPCIWGRDSSERTVETVDFAFKVGKRTVWQAADGTQFVAVRISQNPPFSCAAVAKVAVPASWSND